jgi:hypothetical protein
VQGLIVIRSTHTVAELEISRAAYDEIAQKLRAAGYDHVFDGELIDMTGIGLTPGPLAERPLPPDRSLVTDEMPAVQVRNVSCFISPDEMRCRLTFPSMRGLGGV